MRVLCVGGGSGGHVTPVLAVINDLAKLDDELSAMFVCDKAFEVQSRGLMEKAVVPVEVKTITAGKLRRYHNTSILRQMLDIPTVGKNFRDMGRILVGYSQSFKILRKFKPDIIFAKGGYVCLPVGYAAKTLGIPLVIHDSDSRPGLTNVLLSKFADGIAVGAPLENYNYPPEKTEYTGIPIDEKFQVVTPEQQKQYKSDIGMVDTSRPLVVVVGGGLGAETINTGVVKSAGELLEQGIAIYHVTGKKHYNRVVESAIKSPLYQIVAFVYKDMHKVLSAGDVVVSRGSATFLQELSALAKPTIIVPASHLGDQNKNAVVYESTNSAKVLTDKEVVDSTTLVKTITSLLNDKEGTANMVKRFHKFAKPSASKDTAQLIWKVYKQHKQAPRTNEIDARK